MLKTLRNRLRQQRRALSEAQQRQHALAATHAFARSKWLNGAKKIAVFFSADGELDTAPLIRALCKRKGVQLFLPVLMHPPFPAPMRFARWSPGAPLRPNRYGIPEPANHRHMLTGCELDLVIVPLVAFDRHGHRLGMGGGYYDRTFAPCRNHSRRPLLIGWAHALQEVPELPARPWDIPLDGVVTEQGIRRFRP